VAAARDTAELAELREELQDRFGPLPEPLENLLLLQQARIKLARAGARAVSFRGGRFAVTPIELDSTQVKRLRAQVPEAVYESGRSQLSLRVPEAPEETFPAVVKLADALLEAISAPADLAAA
jgi:transcription-repair coupling factor (superfamily II helicase)